MNAQEFIDEYTDNLLNIEKLNREEQALIDSVLTPEIKEKLNEIEAEFAPKITELNQRNDALIQMAKGEVLSRAVEQLQLQLPKEM